MRQGKHLQNGYRSLIRKNKEEFLEMIRNTRKELQAKINATPHQQTYIHHIVSIQKPACEKESIRQVKQRLKEVGDYSMGLQTIPSILSNQGYSQNQLQVIWQQEKESLTKKKKQSNLKFNKNKRRQLSPVLQIKSKTCTAARKSLKSKKILSFLQQSKFQTYFIKIPFHRDKRNSSHLQPALYFLKQNNKMFTQMEENLASSLLKIGTFIELQIGQTLYCMGFDKKCVYIILEGAVKIINENTGMKKICAQGETLGEEMLFGNSSLQKYLQTAKAITKTYVLQLKVQEYNLICQQSLTYGYVDAIGMFESKFRQGYTSKNVKRQQHIVDRKKKSMPNNYIYIFQ